MPPHSLSPEETRCKGILRVFEAEPPRRRENLSRLLKVLGADDKLLAQFPATIGSTHDPSPIGTWKVLGISHNPEFRYNPDLFWDADQDDEKAVLPPGPNGPVGVV